MKNYSGWISMKSGLTYFWSVDVTEKPKPNNIYGGLISELVIYAADCSMLALFKAGTSMQDRTYRAPTPEARDLYGALIERFNEVNKEDEGEMATGEVAAKEKKAKDNLYHVPCKYAACISNEDNNCTILKDTNFHGRMCPFFKKNHIPEGKPIKNAI